MVSSNSNVVTLLGKEMVELMGSDPEADQKLRRQFDSTGIPRRMVGQLVESSWQLYQLQFRGKQKKMKHTEKLFLELWQNFIPSPGKTKLSPVQAVIVFTVLKKGREFHILHRVGKTASAADRMSEVAPLLNGASQIDAPTWRALLQRAAGMSICTASFAQKASKLLAV